MLLGATALSAQIINPPSALPNGATATTQSPGDNSTKIATTAYAQNPGAITPSSVTTSALTVTALANPTGTPTGTPSATGGTVAAGANYMKVVAIGPAGNHTNVGTESALVTTASCGTSPLTCSIAWAWTAVTGASSYQIWVGATSGTEANYFTSTTNSFTQILPIASGTGGTMPTSNTTGAVSLPAGSVAYAALNGTPSSDKQWSGVTLGNGSSIGANGYTVIFPSGANIVRMSGSFGNIGTCSVTYPVLAIYDVTASALISGATLTLPSSGYAASGTLTATIPAGHVVEPYWSVADSGCSIYVPTPGYFTVTYQ